MAFFCVHESGLPDSGRKTLDTKSSSVVPLKSYGYDGSNGLYGRSKTSKLSTEIGEKVNFLVKGSVPENFQRKTFLGLVPTESLRTKDSENIVSLGDRAFVAKL